MLSILDALNNITNEQYIDFLGIFFSALFGGIITILAVILQFQKQKESDMINELEQCESYYKRCVDETRYNHKILSLLKEHYKIRSPQVDFNWINDIVVMETLSFVAYKSIMNTSLHRYLKKDMYINLTLAYEQLRILTAYTKFALELFKSTESSPKPRYDELQASSLFHIERAIESLDKNLATSKENMLYFKNQIQKIEERKLINKIKYLYKNISNIVSPYDPSYIRELKNETL